jgi:hypothetical protein
MHQHARRAARYLPPSVREALKRAPREELPSDRVAPAFRAFAGAHASDLRGDVLVAAGLEELVSGRAYVLDDDVQSGRATVVADLAEPGSLPPARFDAIALPELDETARANVWQALRAGGVLLTGAERAVKDA